MARDCRYMIEDIKMSAECALCGEDFPAALDFHHLDPATKLANVNTMGRYVPSRWPEVLAEIEKCVVLCCNCHRKAHGGVLSMKNLKAHVVPTRYREWIPIGRSGLQ